MLIGAVYIGITGASMSLDLGDNVMSMSGSLSDAEMAAAGLPSAGRLRFGGILSILGSISALALLVSTLARKELIPTAALATFSLFVLAILFYPNFENGPPADLTPRTQAMIAAAFALAGALGSMMVKVEANRRSRMAAASTTGESSATSTMPSDDTPALSMTGRLAALTASEDLYTVFSSVGDEYAALSSSGDPQVS